MSDKKEATATVHSATMIEEWVTTACIQAKIPGFDGLVCSDLKASITLIHWRGMAWTIKSGEKIPRDVLGQMLLLA
ncbi:hypothetical protein UFOVP470_35 [uncultured Caudovirales phage]|uniref:Uncharacterized protein n=1 Tax=uncultured Caudovirales phage TaxID=2100421 RepID=A0A6J5ME65_9CAUD|nr:hypothetical protein UFOVP470_35 [uncultured Caudovirales phage]